VGYDGFVVSYDGIVVGYDGFIASTMANSTNPFQGEPSKRISKWKDSPGKIKPKVRTLDLGQAFLRHKVL
jgi:hypothetical protein